jgi:rare lipoprotein A
MEPAYPRAPQTQERVVLSTVTTSWRHAVRLLSLSVAAATVLSACSSMGLGPTVKRAAFTSEEFGVKSSPRVTGNPNPPRGGGRNLVGKPYVVRGQTYVPLENPMGYVGSGKGSWYGADFHGRLTANGEIFSANAITGAHPTLPLPSYVRVTNQNNGRSLIVRVNDRGPYLAGRVMDLSYRAAAMLGYVEQGSAPVSVEYLGRAPLEGDDTRMLVASYSGPNEFGSHTRVAAADNTNSLADMAGNFIGGIFSYAEAAPVQDGPDGSAMAAVNALAIQALPPDAQPVRLELGSYADGAGATNIAQQFAALGAVESISGDGSTALRMTALKPGVSIVDVQHLAQELGLDGIVLY